MNSPVDPASIEQVRRLARGLDTSIRLPGGFQVGWDAVLGLVPVVGDWAGALLSSCIVLQAVRLGGSPEVLLRMVGNVAVEALVGAVPFLGSLVPDGVFVPWEGGVRFEELPPPTQAGVESWNSGRGTSRNTRFLMTVNNTTLGAAEIARGGAYSVVTFTV